MRHLAIAALVAMPGLLQAQLPEVDITLVPVTSTTYEVRIRPDGTFNGLFSSLVFTLRWPDASGVTLTEFVPTDAMIDLGVYPALAGDMVIADGFRYAAHVAFGNSALVNEGQSWVPGQEVVIGTIDQVGGTATMEIVNDNWTGDNNSDFFISLNGVDRTGVIYGSTTAQVVVASAVSPFALIASQGEDQAVLRVTAPTAGTARYEVVASNGSIVGAGRFNIQPGTTEVGIPTNAWAVGLYTINVRTPSASRSIKIAITE